MSSFPFPFALVVLPKTLLLTYNASYYVFFPVSLLICLFLIGIPTKGRGVYIVYVGYVVYLSLQFIVLETSDALIALFSFSFILGATRSRSLCRSFTPDSPCAHNYYFVPQT